MKSNEEREQKIIKKLMNIEDFTKVKVRIDDTDFMQVVHFKNYLMYFDDGFVSFINNTTESVLNIIEKGIVFPVKKIEITYDYSAKFGDNIIVKTRIIEMGDTSMIFSHELYRESDNKLLSKVKCVRLIMELKTNKLLSTKEFFSEYID